MATHELGIGNLSAVPGVVEKHLEQFFDEHGPAISAIGEPVSEAVAPVSYTHLRAHETLS